MFTGELKKGVYLYYNDLMTDLISYNQSYIIIIDNRKSKEEQMRDLGKLVKKYYAIRHQNHRER